MTDNRDSIDFAREPLGKLFRGIFFPTLLGLFFGAVLNIADGMFVGRGVGSDALAAINVAAPFYLITYAVSMMFGTGASIVAAIHLGKGNTKAARINVTLACVVSVLVQAVLIGALCLSPALTCNIFGGSERLEPLFRAYVFGVAPGLVVAPVAMIGLYVLRLDGSSKLAGAIQVAYSLINIVLDYLFVFPFGFGIAGAAWATGLSEILGTLAVVIYMLFFSKTLRPYLPKLSLTSLQLSLRNVGYMTKVGFSAFLGEIAMTCVMITGNYCFLERWGEDGVAAYSVACYLFPLFFMMGQAISQSAQPIISYNVGQENWERVGKAQRLSYWFAFVLGMAISLFGIFATPLIARLFLEPCPAYDIACQGLPWYATAFVFFTLNIVMIGYQQSRERATRATLYTLLRGFVFVLPAFTLLPMVLGERGLWLAIPASEAMTLVVMVVANGILHRPSKQPSNRTTD